MTLKFLKSVGFTIKAIPPRDLEDDELDRYGGEEYLTATGLYARVLETHAEREQQAPAAPIEKPKRKHKKANRELAKEE
jgi:uncharacterized membrane protein YqiK